MNNKINLLRKVYKKKNNTHGNNLIYKSMLNYK